MADVKCVNYVNFIFWYHDLGMFETTPYKCSVQHILWQFLLAERIIFHFWNWQLWNLDKNIIKYNSAIFLISSTIGVLKAELYWESWKKEIVEGSLNSKYYMIYFSIITYHIRHNINFITLLLVCMQSIPLKFIYPKVLITRH